LRTGETVRQHPERGDEAKFIRVAVLGAGSDGLNSDLRLTQEIPNADIINIIAESFDVDTLSSGPAGGFGSCFDGHPPSVTGRTIYVGCTAVGPYHSVT